MTTINALTYTVGQATCRKSTQLAAGEGYGRTEQYYDLHKVGNVLENQIFTLRVYPDYMRGDKRTTAFEKAEFIQRPFANLLRHFHVHEG